MSKFVARFKLWMCGDVYLRLDALETKYNAEFQRANNNRSNNNEDFHGVAQALEGLASRLGNLEAVTEIRVTASASEYDGLDARLEALENGKEQERKDSKQAFGDLVGTLASFSLRVEAVEKAVSRALPGAVGAAVDAMKAAANRKPKAK